MKHTGCLLERHGKKNTEATARNGQQSLENGLRDRRFRRLGHVRNVSRITAREGSRVQERTRSIKVKLKENDQEGLANDSTEQKQQLLTAE